MMARPTFCELVSLSPSHRGSPSVSGAPLPISVTAEYRRFYSKDEIKGQRWRADSIPAFYPRHHSSSLLRQSVKSLRQMTCK